MKLRHPSLTDWLIATHVRDVVLPPLGFALLPVLVALPVLDPLLQNRSNLLQLPLEAANGRSQVP